MTWKSSNNLIILGRNRNTLKKRQRQSWKQTNLDRHCPTLVTNNSLLADPTYFSLYTTFKAREIAKILGKKYLGLKTPWVVPGFHYGFTERNSELFSLPRNGSERNSESLLLFLFHGTEFRVVFSFAEGLGTEFRELALLLFHKTEFRVVFSSAEGFGTEFREFCVPRNSRNSVGNNHLFRLFSLPRNYFFLSEIPNPTQAISGAFISSPMDIYRPWLAPVCRNIVCQNRKDSSNFVLMFGLCDEGSGYCIFGLAKPSK